MTAFYGILVIFWIQFVSLGLLKGIRQVDPVYAENRTVHLFLFSKRRRRVNLLITTFLPVDGKAEGSITCRGEQEDQGENYERKIKGGGD